MKTFGIRTHGLEIEWENLIIEYIKERSEQLIRYYEIGTAGGITLKAISDILQENTDTWLATGIDLAENSSVSWAELDSVFSKKTLQLFINGLSNITYLDPPKTRLLLWDNPREYSKSLSNNILDIVLIDGNHNKYNVIQDFLSIEDKVKIGGLVLFHDIGVEETGTDPQAGGGFIEVRNAVEELNLFNGLRSGWKFIKEIAGSRKYGGDGNSLGVFQKIA